MEGFTNALEIAGGTNDLVTGNQFGAKIGSVTLTPNHLNILISGTATGVTVGGTSPALRNVIDSATYGIELLGGPGANAIVGNLIGTYGGEGTSGGNTTGIYIATPNNLIQRNTIVNSGDDGIRIYGTNAYFNELGYNKIGKIETRCFVLNGVQTCLNDSRPNGRDGVHIQSGAHDNGLYLNEIAHNVVNGITITNSSKGMEIDANSIHDNDGVGIELVGSSGNDNDADPGAANLPNRGLNYPVITLAAGGPRTGTITGTLASTNGDYVIQAFASDQCDDIGRGEGQFSLGQGGVIINNASGGSDGSATFTFDFSAYAFDLTGKSITTTARDNQFSTSEFSSCQPYLCDVIFRHAFDSYLGEKCPLP